MMKTDPPTGTRRAASRALLAVVLITLVAGCDTSVEPVLTPGEIIRLTLEQGGDESILYSNAIIYDQAGTDLYTRSADSIHRGFRNPRFWENDQDFPSPRTTFEADVVDTAWGTLTFKIGASTRSVPFVALNYGGFTQMFENGGPWELLRVEYRDASRPNQFGDPRIVSMSVSDTSTSRTIVATGNAVRVKVIKDTLLTLPVGTSSGLMVAVQTDAVDDSLFITWPTGAGYMTQVMAKQTDSVTHVASVTVESGRRFELLAVQAFKAEAFTNPAYPEAAASAIQTTILAFR